MKRMLRALLGALWSLPLRFLTVPAMLYAGILAGGGVALRFVDNLTIEFAIFPAIMKIITKRGSQ